MGTLNGRVNGTDPAKATSVAWSTEGVGRVEDMTPGEKEARRRRLEPLVVRNLSQFMKRERERAAEFGSVDRESNYLQIAREVLARMNGYVATWG